MDNTIIFDLVFVDPGVALHPVAIIEVKSTGTQTYGSQEYSGLITPECVSMQELDYQIEFLKRELEKVRAEGYRKFNKKAA